MASNSFYFERFFHLSSELFLVTNGKGKIERVNSQWKELLGHEPSDLVGREVLDFVFNEDVERTRASGNEVRANSEIKGFENRLLHKDGKALWFRWQGFIDPETGFYYGTGKEITAERLAHQNLERVVTNAYESEQFERILSQIAPIAIFRTNMEGAVTYVNPVWEELAGMPMEKALGHGWIEAIHPEDKKWMPTRWKEAIETGSKTPVEYRFRRPDGKISWMYGTYAPMKDMEGKPIGYLGASLDITALRENEAHLNQNRQLLDSFMKYTPSSMYVKDCQGRMLLVNADYENRFAYRGIDWKGRDVTELMPDEFGKIVFKNDKEVMESREARTFEERVVHPDGIRTYLSAKFPIFDVQGEISGLGGISTDVTDIVREREKSELLRQLIESSKDGFGYCDNEGRPIYLNRFLTEELGWITNRASISDFVSAETALLYREQILPLLSRGKDHWEGEVEFINRNTGELIPVWLKAFCALDEQGKPRYFAFFANDLRAKRTSEAAILHSSKMASLGEMAAGVAHEVNNPITIIHGTAGLMKKLIQAGPFDREKLEKGIDRIEKTAMRISKIVKGLRMFSRSGENDPPIHTPLKDIVEETLDVCRERFRDHTIELRVADIPDQLLRCRPTQISQVLLNLLNNSFDAVANYSEKWVAIDFSLNPEQIRISVTDSGTGIPNDIVKRLMEPFFTTKDPGKGTGLGLPISRGIIEEHGGTLIYDKDSPRTRFIIEMPIVATVHHVTKKANDDLPTSA